MALTGLGFGAAPIGNLYRPINDATAAGAVAAAWDGGIRYFDTAPHYGLGLSERRLGSALQDKPRNEYVVSTKVGRLLRPNPSPRGSDLEAGGFAVPDDLIRIRDYSRSGVLRSIESSLDRLGLDRVDIVYAHDPEHHMNAAISEAIPALIELRNQGAVGAVGAGMNFVEPLRRFVAETDVDVIMVAGRWTLVDQSAEPLLGECAHANVAVVAAAPFNSGLLARPLPGRWRPLRLRHGSGGRAGGCASRRSCVRASRHRAAGRGGSVSAPSPGGRERRRRNENGGASGPQHLVDERSTR